MNKYTGSHDPGMCKNKIYKSEIILKPFFGLFHGSAFLDRGNRINATKVHSEQPINNIKLTFFWHRCWERWTRTTWFEAYWRLFVGTSGGLSAVENVFWFCIILNIKWQTTRWCWLHLPASKAAQKRKLSERPLTPLLHLWSETKHCEDADRKGVFQTNK